jgi:hypothetical protein
MSASRRALSTLVLVAVGLAGCSSAPTAEAPGTTSATRLTATLVSPIDVMLEWKGDEPGAAGRIVEYSPRSRGDYTVLQFVPLEQTTFKHPDLMPKTAFYYRVRPFYGPASAPVHVTLPPGPTDEKDETSDHTWADPRTVPGPAVAKQPIRSAGASTAGAPTDLTATVMHANAVKLTWTDHASDEEGFLVEMKPLGSSDFRVLAVLDPDINSFGVITQPEEKTASLRVRAFYFGAASNVAHQVTGAEPGSR